MYGKRINHIKLLQCIAFVFRSDVCVEIVIEKISALLTLSGWYTDYYIKVVSFNSNIDQLFPLFFFAS